MSAALSLTDPDGQTVPSQILESTRYADGGLKTARIAFVARDVPAMGYSTYHVSPARGDVAGPMAARPRRRLESAGHA